MIISVSKNTESMARRVGDARRTLRALEASLSDALLADAGVRFGTIVEPHRSPGLHYRVISASGDLGLGDRVQVVVITRRIWRGGRRAGQLASDRTTFHLSDVEIVEGSDE